MVSINPAQAAAAAADASSKSATAGDAASASLDYNAFLKLLLAQLKNQDPLEPLKSTDYVAQLATFSNVEQGIKQNAKLDSILIATSLAQADGAVGRTVTSADGITTGKVKSVRIDASGAVALLEGGKEVPLTAGVVIGQ